jgi:hypothetical protein
MVSFLRLLLKKLIIRLETSIVKEREERERKWLEEQIGDDRASSSGSKRDSLT